MLHNLFVSIIEGDRKIAEDYSRTRMKIKHAHTTQIERETTRTHLHTHEEEAAIVKLCHVKANNFNRHLFFRAS